jgi:hypothetical protein
MGSTTTAFPTAPSAVVDVAGPREAQSADRRRRRVRHVGLASAITLVAVFACSSSRADNAPWPAYVCEVGDQGDGTPSCTGWAVGFYAKSMMQAKRRGSIDCQERSHLFSPSWIYNQILPRGASVGRAGELLDHCGAATLKTMPYTKDVAVSPGSDARAEAGRHRNVRHWHLAPKYVEDPLGAWTAFVAEVKEQLRARPVVLEIFVPEDFKELGSGGTQPAEQWVKGANMNVPDGEPTHAITCIDWDDRRFGGAFRFVNSWGRTWGKDGYVWISYADLQAIARMAWCFEEYDPDHPPLDAAGQPLDYSRADEKCEALTAPATAPREETATVVARLGTVVAIRGPWIAVYPGNPVHRGVSGASASVKPVPDASGRVVGVAGGLALVGSDGIDTETIGAVRHVFQYRAARPGDYEVEIRVRRPADQYLLGTRTVRVTVNP